MREGACIYGHSEPTAQPVVPKQTGKQTNQGHAYFMSLSKFICLDMVIAVHKATQVP
eukprot:m.233077 g.233077  ORF g.233077 m.233077 type:complete len:57 (+) comp15242_c2_seq1:201-371(+)